MVSLPNVELWTQHCWPGRSHLGGCGGCFGKSHRKIQCERFLSEKQNKLELCCCLALLCTCRVNKSLLGALRKGDNRMRKGERRERSLDRERALHRNRLTCQGLSVCKEMLERDV